MRYYAVIAFSLIFLSQAAWASSTTEHPAEHSSHAEHATGEGQQSDLTLLQVMQDLAFQLSRIQYGILTNNRYMIKQGAMSIANHPAPKGGIKPYVKKNAEQIKSAVPVMDKQVHQTSLHMAEAADTATMSDIQKMADTIVSGCVSCHNLFRD